MEMRLFLLIAVPTLATAATAVTLLAAVVLAARERADAVGAAVDAAGAVADAVGAVVAVVGAVAAADAVAGAEAAAAATPADHAFGTAVGGLEVRPLPPHPPKHTIDELPHAFGFLAKSVLEKQNTYFCLPN
ncbi:hypothetical protein AAHC03_013969 [Spirometra sp. Aus1]